MPNKPPRQPNITTAKNANDAAMTRFGRISLRFAS